MKTAAVTLLLAIAFVAAVIIATVFMPVCAPDEVMVRGLFLPVCVKGH